MIDLVIAQVIVEELEKLGTKQDGIVTLLLDDLYPHLSDSELQEVPDSALKNVQ
jgi:hypothetical protein